MSVTAAAVRAAPPAADAAAGPTDRGYPVLTQASHTRFNRGGVLHFPCVQSRMVLGCHDGHGTVELNGMEHPLTPGRLFLLPWGHRITYRADAVDPFFVYGMHVVPWHQADVAIELTTAHMPRHHLFDAPWRAPARPGASPPAAHVVVSSERERPVLAALTRYAIEAFTHARMTDASARAMGTLALTELDAPPTVGAHGSEAPDRLRDLLDWVDARLGQPIALADLARAAGCAPATVTRMFGRHLGRSPMAWITDRRIDRARHLLASTHLRITRIGRSCGFDDPYYFSRVFKARTGMSPSQWRLRHQL